jgi:hypothetical protein
MTNSVILTCDSPISLESLNDMVNGFAAMGLGIDPSNFEGFSFLSDLMMSEPQW